MNYPTDKNAHYIDPRIRKELTAAAKRLRDIKVYRGNLRRWLIASGIAILILGFSTFWPDFSSFAFPAVAFVILVTLYKNFVAKIHIPMDFGDTAVQVEKEFPNLENMLSTAIEQKRTPQGFNFLQEKVISQALHFSFFQYWEDTGKKDLAKLKLIHFGALMWIAALSALSWFSKSEESWIDAPSMPVLTSSVKVTPGNTEVERGSALVIAARFKGDVPRTASLILQKDDGDRVIYAMAQSLSDPVFAYTLPSVEESSHYYIEFPRKETARYRLEVYDLPALAQADAFLDYPEYTGIRDRLTEDTRRVSAVEGTILNYQFLVNKPLATAELEDTEGVRIQLSPTNPEKTKFATEINLTESLRFHLHLTDEQDRKNAYPPDIRIEVRENKRPELTLNFPRDDQAVSPIEELILEAKANDDFGLVDYGIALSIGANNPEYVSLKSQEEDSIEASFDKLYALEKEAVEVDQLVTWFVWADDFVADGQSRRTSSDLYYAKVRPLEEIYREGEAAGGQSMGGRGPEGEILNQQRQIAIVTFKLKQRGIEAPSFLEDTEVLHEIQQKIWLQLEQIKMELHEGKILTAANQAGEFMEKAIEHFSEILAEESEEPVGPAWLAAQGAYQSLLRMRPREMNVTQGRHQAGGGGGGQNRNQRQLNQLEFSEEENRYETESQAQALTTPQEREQLEVLSKLNQLARRQQQVNERLHEMQTALAAVENEEEREIRRELKRLEEEQRRMLTQMDELRHRMENLPSNRETREAREQMEETREDMRNISESLQDGEVSKALASGSRAQENLENLREEFRQNTSSQFAEGMEQVRDVARELAENQRELSKQLDEVENEQAPRLDDSGDRKEIADRFRQQREGLENLMNDLRQITEDSESGEPTLHRKLYNVIRSQNQNEAGEQLKIGEELVLRGFLNQAQEMQPELQEAFNDLERQISEAAESIMGDATTELRFAQEELAELIDQLEQEGPEGSEMAKANAGQSGQSESREQSQGERSPEQQSSKEGQQDGELTQSQGQQGGQKESQLAKSGQQPGQNNPGGQNRGGNIQTTISGGGGNQLLDLENFIRSFSENTGGWDGPITGRDFRDWNERLRTVEGLMELPEARERMQQARERAERMRAEFKRHGNPPQWEDIDTLILSPIQEVHSWVQQELLRKDRSDVLQPVDRDPVPPKFTESVKRYYEALGGDS